MVDHLRGVTSEFSVSCTIVLLTSGLAWAI